MVDTITQSTGAFDGKTVSDMKSGILSKLGETGYTRYTEAEILERINEAQRHFARKTRCLRGYGIMILKANRREYKLPSLFMDFVNQRYPVEYREASGGDRRVERISMQTLANDYSGWRTQTEDPPSLIYRAGQYGNTRLVGVYPLPQTDGNSYVAGTDTGIYVSSTGASVGGNITGTHKAGFANSAFYVDSAGRNFVTLGVLVGMTIRNETDGSSGQITAIGNQDATNDKISVTLTGGTDNDFDVSDAVTIYAGEYGVVTSWDDAGEKYLFSSELGTLAQITVPDRNLHFDYIRYPVKLLLDAQYPEIMPNYHEALEWRSAAILIGTEHDGRLDLGKAQSYMAMYNDELADAIGEPTNLGTQEAVEPDEDYIGEL